jgi:hypothetical protein
VTGAFVSLNGMTRYSYDLYQVRKAIFFSSSSFILIRLYAPYRLSVMNYFTPRIRSCSSEIKGNVYRFLTMISFRRR